MRAPAALPPSPMNPLRDDDPDDALLRDLVTGARQADDPEVRRRLAERPDLRDRLARLRAGAASRDAARPPEAEEPYLRALELRRRAARRVQVGFLAAAVGVVLLGAGAWWMLVTQAPSDLGRSARAAARNQVRLGTAFAAEPEGRTLRWVDPNPLAAGEHYVLRVLAAPGATESVAEHRLAREPAWRPTDADLAALPDPFWYTVDVHGSQGVVRPGPEPAGPVLR